MENKNVPKKQVVFFPLPAAGHLNPMFHVAQALHSKKTVSITFILTKLTPLNPSNFPPDYTFHLIDADSDAAQLLTSATDRKMMSGLAALQATFNKPFRDCVASLLAGQETGTRDVACLIADLVWHITIPVCKEFKLPRIVLPVNLVSDLIILTPPEDRPQKYGQYPEILELTGNIYESSAIIFNSWEEIEGPSLQALEQLLPDTKLFPIGPLHKHSKTSWTSSLVQDKTQIISWLDNHPPKSVLYVSFGSVATLSEAEIEEIAWGLANSNQPFLWVVRKDLIQKKAELSDALPQGFMEAISERGLIVPWAPQHEVLSHVAVGGAFVHGSWNSTVEGLAEGMPVICMPCQFPDQKTTAKYVSSVWKIGLHIERGVKRKEVEDAIRTIMISEDGKEIRENAIKFKDMIKKCLDEGGSSRNSLEMLSNYILSLSCEKITIGLLQT